MKKRILPLSLLLVVLAISVAGCAGGLDTSRFYVPPITEYSEPNPTPTPSEIPVTDTVWSTYFGPIYEGSRASYLLSGVNSNMMEFTGTREVKVLEVTEDVLVTEEVEVINTGGIEFQKVQYTRLNMLSGGEISVTVYTMYNNDGIVSYYTCNSSASTMGGESWETLLTGAQVTDFGQEYVYIPDVGKLTTQHTISNTVMGDVEEMVANFTVERWAVTDGTLPIEGTVYSISTMDAGYGQSTVTVAQLQSFNLTGAQAVITADLIAGAIEAACPF